MQTRTVLIRSLAAVFVITLALTAGIFAGTSTDDRSDAWVSVSQMLKFIEMGDKASVERAGNDALTALEKAGDKEPDSGKKDKLSSAKGKVREALSHAGREDWPYAESAAKAALALIEEAK